MGDITIKFSFENGDSKAPALFARLADPAPVLRDFGEYKRRQIVRSFQRLPRSVRSQAGVAPAMRSGLFAQRITYSVEGSRLDVGTNDVRARILQDGGTIRPKTAKALAVPVHKDAQGKRPRDFSNLVYIARKGSGKAPLLARLRTKERKSGTVTTGMDVMFILLRSVTIKARPYLLWRPEDELNLVKALKRHIRLEGSAA